MTASETARADDSTLETVDAGHFVVDERPDLVHKKVIALADETARSIPLHEQLWGHSINNQLATRTAVCHQSASHAVRRYERHGLS